MHVDVVWAGDQPDVKPVWSGQLDAIPNPKACLYIEGVGKVVGVVEVLWVLDHAGPRVEVHVR